MKIKYVIFQKRREDMTLAQYRDSCLELKERFTLKMLGEQAGVPKIIANIENNIKYGFFFRKLMVCMSVPLLPFDRFIELVKELMDQHGITSKEIGDYIGLPPSSMSKIFTKKKHHRDLSYAEAHDMINYIIQRMSLIPHNVETIIYSSKIQLLFAYENETILSIAKKMRENNVSQLPVFSQEKGYLGLVTELSLLKRILRVKLLENIEDLTKEPKVESLTGLKSLTIRDAGVVDRVPEYPMETNFREIAQLLTYYYAIPLFEGAKVVGIITRADILKLLTE